MVTEPVLSPASEAGSEAPAPPTAPIRTRRQVLRWLAGLTIFSTIAMVLTPIVGFLVPTKSGGAAAGGKMLVGTTTDIPPGARQGRGDGQQARHRRQHRAGREGLLRDLHPPRAASSPGTTWSGVIQCPCHDGRFNPPSGAVVSGPPPAPLPPITVDGRGRPDLPDRRPDDGHRLHDRHRRSPGRRRSGGWLDERTRLGPLRRGGAPRPDPDVRADLLLRRDRAVPVRHPGRHWHVARPVLQVDAGGRVHERPVHHQRRQLRLADPEHPPLGREPDDPVRRPAPRCGSSSRRRTSTRARSRGSWAWGCSW